VSAKRVNLALQGGGAHGAFTWGALDRLLEEEGVEIEGISATSAGAMNAAALKSGMVAGGPSEARAALDRFWLRLAGLEGYASDGVLDWLLAAAPSPAFTARALELSPVALAAEAVTRAFSPYQFNPGNYHPLRAAVTEMLDYDAVCAGAWPKLSSARPTCGPARTRSSPATRSRPTPSSPLPACPRSTRRSRSRTRRRACWRLIGTAATWAIRHFIR
jgi:NTE family protein